MRLLAGRTARRAIAFTQKRPSFRCGQDVCSGRRHVVLGRQDRATVGFYSHDVREVDRMGTVATDDAPLIGFESGAMATRMCENVDAEQLILDEGVVERSQVRAPAADIAGNCWFDVQIIPDPMSKIIAAGRKTGGF